MKEKFYHIDDALLVKYLLEETNKDENIVVEQWIAADSGNQKYYNDFKLIWQQSKNFAATSSLDEEASWQKFQNRIKNGESIQASVKSIESFQWLKIAAMIVLIAGAAFFTYTMFSKKESKTLAIKSLDHVIIDTLPDNSVITLNKNSTLNYPEKFTGDIRAVNLQGEAFFSVTPDKIKPFVIYVNDITVKVVGTSFNIKSTNGSTEIIVETGIVKVIHRSKEVDLHPEEKILVKNEDSVLVKENEKGTLYNYYRTKQFECDNTPLWQLVQVLNQAYNVDIIIERKELRNLPLTTTFNNESLDNILEIIRETFNISIAKAGNQIILK